MLFNKSRNTEATQELNKVLYDVPKILLVDINDDVSTQLSKDGFNITTGSFGKKYRTNGRNPICMLNGELPFLTEQDIIIVDMTREDGCTGNNPADGAALTKGNMNFLTTSEGQNYFEPSWCYALNYKRDIEKVIKNGGILIVYSIAPVDELYYLAEINNGWFYPRGTQSISNFDWIPIESFRYEGYGSRSCPVGQEVFLNDDYRLENLLKSYNSNIFYESTFLLPTYEHNIVPLLHNRHQEVIGFMDILDNGIIIILPQFEDKYTSLTNILKNFLPDLKPELFPTFVSNYWLDEEEYLFPQTQALLSERDDLTNEYQKNLDEIDSKILSTKSEFAFMTNILIASGQGDFLVENVANVLKFIGYREVIMGDDHLEEGANRQEDLQILDNERLTIIEVKGHNGNPTEDDCQALNKYITRNIKKNQRPDVHGILIVNHQKYLEPSKRQFPAFMQPQIDDALTQGYTLVDTWQLFQATRLFQEGIIRFEELDNSLHSPGLFSALPLTFHSLGKIEKLFHEGTTACFYLEVELLKINDELVIQDGNKYQKQVLKEMKIDNDLVEAAVKGQPVSIKLDIAVSKKAKVYLRSSV